MLAVDFQGATVAPLLLAETVADTAA